MSIEEPTDASSFPFVEPTGCDVLLGRGKHAEKCIGNQIFRQVISENANAYREVDSATKRDEIANKVMAEIQASGCRFLKLQKLRTAADAPNRWIVISKNAARIKVKQALRDATKPTPLSRRATSELRRLWLSEDTRIIPRIDSYDNLPLSFNGNSSRACDLLPSSLPAFGSAPDILSLSMPGITTRETSSARSDGWRYSTFDHLCMTEQPDSMYRRQVHTLGLSHTEADVSKASAVFARDLPKVRTHMDPQRYSGCTLNDPSFLHTFHLDEPSFGHDQTIGSLPRNISEPTMTTGASGGFATLPQGPQDELRRVPRETIQGTIDEKIPTPRFEKVVINHGVEGTEFTRVAEHNVVNDCQDAKLPVDVFDCINMNSNNLVGNLAEATAHCVGTGTRDGMHAKETRGSYKARKDTEEGLAPGRGLPGQQQ